jgi:hypothetical protein
MPAQNPGVVSPPTGSQYASPPSSSLTVRPNNSAIPANTGIAPIVGYGGIGAGMTTATAFGSLPTIYSPYVSPPAETTSTQNYNAASGTVVGATGAISGTSSATGSPGLSPGMIAAGLGILLLALLVL